jgi:hypothetical protein
VREVRKKLDLREKLRKLSEERARSGPILRAKKIVEAPLKPKLISIEELKFPSGLPLEEGEIVSSKTRLEETLSHKENSQIEVKWTVAEDTYAEEFGSVVKEGFKQVKTHPPTYALEFEDGGIVASHMGAYTFILGSYNIKIDKLAEMLEFALNALKPKLT